MANTEINGRIILNADEAERKLSQLNTLLTETKDLIGSISNSISNLEIGITTNAKSENL